MVLNFTPYPSFVICGTKIFQPNEMHITRIYNHSVLILMTEGELKFAENGRLITLHAGEYYIQRDGLLQQGVAMTSLPKYFFIEFDGSFSENESGLPLQGHFDHKKIASLTESCENQFVQRHANTFKLGAYMLRIFSELLDSAPASNEHQTLAQRVCNYIDSQYTSQISLSDISYKFGFTEEYIVRIFKKHYQISPHQYIIKLRMEQAMWLLENTDISIEQVAVSVGYTDISAFYRGFKKFYDSSPNRMRKR